MESLWENFFSAYFLPCHVPYYSNGERLSSSQPQEECPLHLFFCINHPCPLCDTAAPLPLMETFHRSPAKAHRTLGVYKKQSDLPPAPVTLSRAACPV